MHRDRGRKRYRAVRVSIVHNRRALAADQPFAVTTINNTNNTATHWNNSSHSFAAFFSTITPRDITEIIRSD